LAVEPNSLFRLSSFSCSKLENGDAFVAALKLPQLSMGKGASNSADPVRPKQTTVLRILFNLVYYPLVSTLSTDLAVAGKDFHKPGTTQEKLYRFVLSLTGGY